MYVYDLGLLNPLRMIETILQGYTRKTYSRSISSGHTIAILTIKTDTHWIDVLRNDISTLVV